VAVESAADLAEFFAEDEHATSATYTPSGGSAVAVTVIYQTGRESEDTQAGLVTRTYRRALLRESEVAVPATGDALAIGASSYTVVGAELADGVWTVGLR